MLYKQVHHLRLTPTCCSMQDGVALRSVLHMERGTTAQLLQQLGAVSPYNCVPQLCIRFIAIGAHSHDG
jgi:hypothetical protein